MDCASAVYDAHEVCGSGNIIYDSALLSVCRDTYEHAVFARTQAIHILHLYEFNRLYHNLFGKFFLNIYFFIFFILY